MRRPALFLTALVASGCAVVAFACGSFSSSDGSPVDGSTDGGIGDGSTPSPDGEAGLASAVDPGVFCGSGPSCDPKTQVCCKDLPGGGGMGCLPVAEAGVCNGTDLACDDGADCAYMPGGICCGDLASNGIGLRESRCFTLNDCKTTPFWVVVCDPNAPKSTACPDAEPCDVPAGGGFGFCRGLVHP